MVWYFAEARLTNRARAQIVRTRDREVQLLLLPQRAEERLRPKRARLAVEPRDGTPCCKMKRQDHSQSAAGLDQGQLMLTTHCLSSESTKTLK